MRYGDWIVMLSMLLNLSAAGLYLYQGFYRNTFYWCCVAGINWCLLKL